MFEISVILPVYNREKYLRETLKSIEDQTFKNFELLIIDDGSTDSSCLIAEEFCYRNRNWKLFHLDHKGVSHARMYGIDVSCGKYISFVDSDDFVRPNFLEVLRGNMGDSQISICNYETIVEGSNFKFRNLRFHRPGIFSRNSVLKSLISDISIKSFLWNKLFERSLFQGIFIPQMCFEDKIMCIQLFYNSKNCSITNKILYNYRKNSSSMTWKMNESMLDDYIKFSEYLKIFFNFKEDYKYFKLRHKMFCVHIFPLAFGVLFSKYIIKDKNLKIFFRKILESCKRIIKSIEI